MLNIFTDDYYMKMALQEAHNARHQGEVPVGAVMVCQQQIIAKASNQTERLQDVTAHAEILAITAASTFLNSKYLNECILYVTLEPCLMCASALAWAQVGKIVFGAGDDKKGFMRFGKEILHPKTLLEYGVMQKECSEIMSLFFRKKRYL